MTNVASTAACDEALRQGRRWYVTWLVTWIGVAAYLAVSADPKRLGMRQQVPLVALHAVLFGLALYLGSGLKQGRWVGRCAAMAGYLAFANAVGCTVSLCVTVTHRWPWSIPLVLALHAVVAAIAAVMLLRAHGMQS